MAVYKDKKKNTYYVKYRINGVSNTKRGFRTKSEAQAYEYKQKLGQVEESKHVRFDVVANEMLNYLKGSATYGSYQKAKRFVDEFIIPHISKKYIDAIDELDCLRFREYVAELDYSTAYKNDIIWIFKAIFGHAEKYYRLKDNPSKKIERFKKTSSEKLKIKDKEMNIWTVEEFEKFIKCVDNEMYKALFVTLYFTGMRKGELLALKWSDFRKDYISVNKSLTRKTENGAYEIKDPKNIFSFRNISLNRSLSEYLMKYKSNEMKIAGFNEDWFMFGRLEPVAENTLTRVKDRAVSKAGVKRITIHEFRHSHASNLIANGVNIVAVSKRLGHSDIQMTLNRYTHLLNKSDKELTDNLEKCSQNVLTV